MKFSDALNEYLELKRIGPKTNIGFTDKAYYARLAEIENAFDWAIPKFDLPENPYMDSRVDDLYD